jgi:ethanolaminephosphotransferase
MSFISPQGLKNLHSFKYVGIDNSLMYKYLSGPFAEYCVKFIPLWMA